MGTISSGSEMCSEDSSDPVCSQSDRSLLAMKKKHGLKKEQNEDATNENVEWDKTKNWEKASKCYTNAQCERVLPNKGNKWSQYRDNCIEADCEAAGMMWPATEPYWANCPNCGGWNNYCMKGGCVPKPTPSPTPAPTYADFWSEWYSLQSFNKDSIDTRIQKECESKGKRWDKDEKKCEGS